MKRLFIIYIAVCCFSILHSSTGFAATINLGYKGLEFGSSGQAAAMLQLIQSTPGQRRYDVLYTTEKDIVVLAWDLQKDILIRMHDTKDNHGSSEKWSGDILYRIKSASDGGSLNDTQQGKKPGTFEVF